MTTDTVDLESRRAIRPDEKNIVRGENGKILRYVATEENPNPILDIKRKRALFELTQQEKIDKLASMPDDKVNQHKVNPRAFLLCTDKKYPLNGFLRDNLDEVAVFIKKKYDCVVIVSGGGKVRVGKSCMAMQCAYYVAWLLNEIKIRKGEIPAGTPVPFTNANVAFDPESLKKMAESYPKNSVFVYDEARSGLDSASSMTAINKTMIDFFSECGQYGHVIILVLPDFFKLSEMIAVPRSLFLINVYTDKNFNRGFFSFYSDKRKELLYVFGKKKFGSTSKYNSVAPNFHGTFGDYLPINREMYEEQKRLALKKKKNTHLEAKWHEQRDAAMYSLYTVNNMSYSDITDEIEKSLGYKISPRIVEFAVQGIKRKLRKENGDQDDNI